MDGKVSRRSYNRETPASTTDSHPAIQLVTVYIAIVRTLFNFERQNKDFSVLVSTRDQGFQPLF